MPVIKSAIVVLRDDNDGLIITNLNNYHPSSSKRIQYRTETNTEQKSLHYVPPKYNKRFIVV
jgi:hypothetical protein